MSGIWRAKLGTAFFPKFFAIRVRATVQFCNAAPRFASVGYDLPTASPRPMTTEESMP